MITRALTLVAFLAALALLLVATAQAAPNVLIVFTDDQGWADLSAHRADSDVATPSVDQLAKEGVLAVRGYVTAPQCAPSRAALITGAYQQRFGIEENDTPLPTDAVTLPERIKAANPTYKTGIVGKWHLGDEDTFQPWDQGFDEACYIKDAATSYTCMQTPDGTPLVGAARGGHYDGQVRVTTDTLESLYFLERRRLDGAPWFLYVVPKAPHVPLNAYEPWYSATDAELPDERRKALSTVSALDDMVRQLREKIAAMGQTDNTMIWFIGDNGAQLDDNWNGSINLPMIGKKGMLTDGGVRIPYVAAWPGHWRAGQVTASPLSSLDVAATVVAAIGADASGLDGADLGPFLASCSPDSDATYQWAACSRAPDETLFWRWNDQAAILAWPWKYIQIGNETGTYYQMLFDTSRPEHEQYGSDQAAQRPEVVSALKARLEAWAATLQVPGLLPSANESYPNIFRDYGVLPPSP